MSDVQHLMMMSANNMTANNNMTEIQQLVEQAIDERAREDIVQILDRISLLKPPERLLLYMRMPSGAPDSDPLRQPQNPLGTRLEINHTINWVRSHLEHDPNVSIPKQDVYDDYFAYCSRIHIKPLSTADFGKVMKQVFPDIRPRRLGTRGNSRYCYAALRKTTRLTPPQLSLDTRRSAPQAAAQLTLHDAPSTAASDAEQQQMNLVRRWAASVLDLDEFATTAELAEYIASNQLIGGIGGGSGGPAARPKSMTALPKARLTAATAAKMKPPAQQQQSATASALAASSTADSPLLNGAKKRRRKRRNSRASNNPSPADGAASSSCLTSPVPSAAPTAVAEKLARANHCNDVSPSPVVDMSLVKQEPTTANAQAQAHQHHQQMAYNYSMPGKKYDDHNEIGGVSSATPPTTYKTELLSDYETEPSVPAASTPSAAASPSALGRPQSAASPAQPAAMSDDADDPIQPHPLCKKVRQAQQTKGLLTMRQYAVNNHAAQQHSRVAAAVAAAAAASAATNTESLMRPPEYSPPSRLPTSEHSSAVARRLALLQQYRSSADKGDGGGGEKGADDVSTDIIIPRERVISICSLDKDALDDYLNGGDNSQDQEVELMGYFQTDDSGGGGGGGTAQANASAMELQLSAAGGMRQQLQQQVPVLENYQLSSEPSQVATAAAAAETNKFPKRSGLSNEKNITDLRYYLQQNLMEATTSAASSAATSSGSAASLEQKPASNNAAREVKQDLETSAETQLPQQSPQSSANTATTSSMIGNSNSFITQSPTTRRRNYSFVPISPGPESPVPSTSLASAATSSTSASASSSFFGAVSSQSQHPFLSPQSAMHPHRKHPPMAGKQQHQQQQHIAHNSPANNIPGDYHQHNQPAQQIRHYSASPSTLPTLSSTLSAPTSPLSANWGRQQQQQQQPMHPQQQLLDQQLQQHQQQQQHHFLTTFHNHQQHQPNNSQHSQLQIRPLELTSASSGASSSDPTALANRSQSAPLHRHMPAIQHPSTAGLLQMATACSSTGSMGGDTPVPPEFSDFSAAMSSSDSTSASQDLLIKCEPIGGNSGRNSVSCDVDMKMASPLSAMHQLQQQQQQQHQHPFFSRELAASMPLVSRSVPSTPQPSQMFGGGGGGGSHFVLGGSSGGDYGGYGGPSMSVPTTPTGLGRSSTMHADHRPTPFRYSPLELNRDFLINGNTVEPKNAFFESGSSQLHQQHLQHVDCGGARGPGSSGLGSGSNEADSLLLGAKQMAGGSGGGGGGMGGDEAARLETVIGDIEELSSYGDASTEPIIGSDLLNNL